MAKYSTRSGLSINLSVFNIDDEERFGKLLENTERGRKSLRGQNTNYFSQALDILQETVDGDLTYAEKIFDEPEEALGTYRRLASVEESDIKQETEQVENVSYETVKDGYLSLANELADTLNSLGYQNGIVD